MPNDTPNRTEPRFILGRLLLTPLGARAAVVMLVTAVLAVVAGIAVVSQVTDQMGREAESRLDRHATDEARALEEIMASASRDIRLARQNEIFEAALARTSDQLFPADRAAVEAAITYLGDRYRVDEICLIRSDGLEAARWVGGKGVAPVADLSPDERQNNPAVLPTLPLADDSFYQSQPYISPDSHRWVLGIATPIILPTAEHAGILHFEIPVERFATEMAGLSFGGTGLSVLLDRSGRVLVHPQLADIRSAQSLSTDANTSPFPLATGSGSASWRDAVSKMLSGHAGSVSFDEAGKAYRASYQPVAGSNRILAVVSPVSELYADVNGALLNLAVTAGPLILLMILVVGWFARRMAGANRRLAGLNERLGSTNTRLEETSKASAELARHCDRQSIQRTDRSH